MEYNASDMSDSDDPAMPPLVTASESDDGMQGSHGPQPVRAANPARASAPPPAATTSYIFGAAARQGVQGAPAARSRTTRPSVEDRTTELLKEPNVINGVLGKAAGGKAHLCSNQFSVGDTWRPCTFNLYSDDFSKAIQRLTQVRKKNMAMPQRERGRAAFEALQVQRVPGKPIEDDSSKKVALTVAGRCVCEPVFLSHFCISSKTLKGLKVRRHSSSSIAVPTAPARAPVRSAALAAAKCRTRARTTRSTACPRPRPSTPSRGGESTPRRRRSVYPIKTT